MPSASDGNGMSCRGPRKSSEPPWYISGSVRVSSTMACPNARCMSSPWLGNAEPSSHCHVRGSGEARRGLVERDLPAHGAALELGGQRRERGRGSAPTTRAPPSRLRAIGCALTARRKSLDTTRRWPSGESSRSVASFMARDHKRPRPPTTPPVLSKEDRRAAPRARLPSKQRTGERMLAGNKVIITVAINGGMQQDRDGAVIPKQPAEIGEAAARCHEAGAAMVHVHARDAQGKNSGDREDLRARSSARSARAHRS